jgi:hypothetical protein
MTHHTCMQLQQDMERSMRALQATPINSLDAVQAAQLMRDTRALMDLIITYEDLPRDRQPCCNALFNKERAYWSVVSSVYLPLTARVY